MKMYTSTGTIRTRDSCNRYNVGLLMSASWRDPSNWPFFAIDNGCYSAYARGVIWDCSTFMRLVHRCVTEGYTPDFIVIPDRVADADSLAFSEKWVPILKELAPDFRMYLPVQDGMKVEDVLAFCSHHFVSGLFVGGTTQWKIETMAELAGADSIDSTTWVQRKNALPKYMKAYHEQTRLDGGVVG